MNIVLIAEQSAGINALLAIAASTHRLVSVLTSAPHEASAAPSVWSEATKVGFEPRPAKLVKDPALADELRSKDADVIINVHSLYVIRGEVLEAARVAAFNLHPGPLPRYAGLNAPSWAIYRGETSYGVTLHRMSAEIDAGPIAYQTLFPIAPSDTALTLNYKCWKGGLVLLERLLRDLASSPAEVPSHPQDRSMREYFGKGVPQNGRINWAMPARDVHNFVRACDFFPYSSPWGSPKATLRGQEIGILKTSLTGKLCREPSGAVTTNQSGIQVACADEWLALETITVPKGAIHAADVLTRGDRICEAA
jgi:methionyl-tRNA formyltransferase